MKNYKNRSRANKQIIKEHNNELTSLQSQISDLTQQNNALNKIVDDIKEKNSKLLGKVVKYEELLKIGSHYNKPNYEKREYTEKIKLLKTELRDWKRKYEYDKRNILYDCDVSKTVLRNKLQNKLEISQNKLQTFANKYIKHELHKLFSINAKYITHFI